MIQDYLQYGDPYSGDTASDKTHSCAGCCWTVWVDINDESVADLNNVRLDGLSYLSPRWDEPTLNVPVTVSPHKNCRISGTAKCCDRS